MRSILIALMVAPFNFLFLVTPAHAVPNIISYQGRLTDAQNNPRDTPAKIRFIIQDASTAEVWSETYNNVPVNNGVFSIELGGPGGIPLDITDFENAELYLKLWVDDQELNPRQRLLSSPYALNAGGVDWNNVTGKPWTVNSGNVYRLTGNVGIGSANPTTALDVAGTIKGTDITCANQTTGCIGAGDLAAGSVGAAELVDGADSAFNDGRYINTSGDETKTGNFTVKGLGWFESGGLPLTVYKPGTTGAIIQALSDYNGTKQAVAFINADGDVWGRTFQPFSDARLKENISDSDSVLDKVNKLKVRKYSFKTEKSNIPTHIGIIAQELEKIFPDLVKATEAGIKAVNVTEISFVMLKAIQEQQKLIEDLKARITALEKK